MGSISHAPSLGGEKQRTNEGAQRKVQVKIAVILTS